MTRSKTYRKSIPLAELAEIHSGYSLRNTAEQKNNSLFTGNIESGRYEAANSMQHSYTSYTIHRCTASDSTPCISESGAAGKSLSLAETVNFVQPHNVISYDFDCLQEIRVKLAKNITVLQPGDVLLTARMNFKAAVFMQQDSKEQKKEKKQPKTLASAAIWIIRPGGSKILPGFMAFWLNSLNGQKALKTLCNEFSTIKSIRKDDLERLSVPLIPQKLQQQIGDAYLCCLKQQSLLKKRFALQHKLLETIAEQAMQ